MSLITQLIKVVIFKKCNDFIKPYFLDFLDFLDFVWG
jgi:hypothetical protein